MNDKLNAIIIDGEMYVLSESCGPSDCDDCDLSERCNPKDGSYACSVFGVERGFSFHHAEHILRRVETIGRP